MHAKFLELGLESPFDEAWLERASTDPPISAVVDVSGYADVRRKALLAHATQVDPTSKFWFGLPPEVLKTVHPVDEYLLAFARGPQRSAEDAPRRICSKGSVPARSRLRADE